MRVVVALLAAGCYRPASVQPCTVSCGTETPCPDELTCVEGRCAASGATCGPGDTDAMPDAPPCPGTLVGKDLLRICLVANLPAATGLSGTIDTSADPRCNAFVLDSDPSLCTIAGENIDVTTRGRHRGARRHSRRRSTCRARSRW